MRSPLILHISFDYLFFFELKFNKGFHFDILFFEALLIPMFLIIGWAMK